MAVTHKASPEEIKEKMEQQLRMQRAAHQQKRALEVKNLNVKNPIDLTGTTTAHSKFHYYYVCLNNNCESDGL